MQKQLENPPFTPLFRIVTGAEIVVVGLAGIGLFFLPILAKPQWPWIMTPFNMAFLGAAYLSSIAAICVMFWGGNWASARLGLWMLVAFTVPILILSLLHLDRFEFLRWATWVWFFLFITIAPYSAYNIWKNRHLPPADTIPLPALWRSYLLIQGIALGLYAIALIIAPNIFTAFWPWRIDEFHGQIYSAIFLTGAAGSIVIWFSASRIELLMLSLTQIVLGFFAILGLVIVEASQHRVNWSVPGTWLWISIFGVLFITGVGLMWLSLANKHAKQAQTQVIQQ